MKRNQWIIVFSCFLLSILLDQYTKYWASSKPEFWLGPLHIVLVHNHGAFLGLFSHLSAFLRVVALSTIGIFLLSMFLFFQHIIPKPVMKLRVGLSLLIGGILGNVVDRIVLGYVIDFISLEIGSFNTPIWNVADMIQWVGYFLLCYALIKEGHLLWPDKNDRVTFWVNKKFQIRYAFIFIAAGLLVALVSFVFSFTYLRMSLTELARLSPEDLKKYIIIFGFSFFSLILIFIMLLFSISKYLSHHIAGPVYAFERYLNELFEKSPEEIEKSALRLRAGDDFKHLEQVAESAKARILELKKNSSIEPVDVKPQNPTE